MAEGTRATILIVDDSAENLQVLPGLPASAYRVLAATSGGRCRDLAHDRPAPDLVRRHIRMRHRNGWRRCRAPGRA